MVATVTLNDGRAMPQLGLGVWQTPAEKTAEVVRIAIETGYRAIDAAAIYGNEAGVGQGVRDSGLADEVWVTTKVWSDHHGYDETLRAFDKSLARLGMESIDLYLIHWPAPQKDRYLPTWRALATLRAEGRARSIGVANFRVEDLERLIGETGVTPAVNQIELHPRFQQSELRALHARLGIATESWSPLGEGKLLADPVIAQVAAKHGKSPAQVIIRWHLELGLIVIPKSANPGRIAENFSVFDFTFDAVDFAALAALDRADGRIGSDPAAFG